MRYDINDQMQLIAGAGKDFGPYIRLMNEFHRHHEHRSPIDYARSVMGRRHKKKGCKR